MGEGDVDVTVNVNQNNISVMRIFAVRTGLPRSKGDTRNTGGQGRTRAGAPYLRRTTSGRIHGDESVIKLGNGFDGGLQSRSS